jgi:hypothetical protein
MPKYNNNIVSKPDFDGCFYSEIEERKLKIKK